MLWLAVPADAVLAVPAIPEMPIPADVVPVRVGAAPDFGLSVQIFDKISMPRITTGSSGVTNGCCWYFSGNSMNWKEEVHQRVRELRRTFLHLSVKTPTDVTFRRLGPTLLRCYFLLSPGQGRESTLFYADINIKTTWGNRIVYQEVLDSGHSFLWRRTSREEQLLSERRRISTWGITNYELHPSSGTLVFPASSTIFQCVHPEQPMGAVSPKELVSLSGAPQPSDLSC
ncbi:dipeptidyl peptidase 8-like [Macrobrachium nipponense]|uniref:dipeptidyl peptidase 8-like n=1 Tax=Macrobrachium nipponense TaxID=159736 RepID=UPI0030C8B31C